MLQAPTPERSGARLLSQIIAQPHPKLQVAEEGKSFFNSLFQENRGEAEVLLARVQIKCPFFDNTSTDLGACKVDLRYNTYKSTHAARKKRLHARDRKQAQLSPDQCFGLCRANRARQRPKLAQGSAGLAF